MKQRLYHYFRNLSIYSRVYRINLGIAIIPVLIVTIFSILIYTSISSRRTAENETKSLFYYSKNIANRLYNFDNAITVVVQSKNIQDFVNNHLTMSELEKYRSTKTVTNEVISHLHTLRYVTDIVLITNQYAAINVFNGPHGDFELEDIDYVTFLKNTVQKSNKTYFADISQYTVSQDINSNREGFLYGKRIVDNDTASTNIGYILVYIDKESFFSFDTNLYTELDHYAERYIMEPGGNIIFSNVISQIGAVRQDIAEHISKQEVIGSYLYFNNNIFTYYELEDLGWFVVTAIPFKIFFSEFYIIAAILIIFMFLLVMVSSFLSSGIAKSILVPVSQLLESLKAIENNNFLVEPADHHTDELADLRNLLNHTKQMLDNLLKQVREVEKQKFDLQFQALQAQINPHFLMNTLNTVNWLADLQGAENIKSIITSLSIILNQVVRQNDLLITVEQEINLLNRYIIIQKFRFFDRFNVDMRIQKETLEEKIPYFILQPLLENCLIHGMDDSISLMNIIVDIHFEEDKLILQVIDDGIGINREQKTDRLQNKGMRQSNAKGKSIQVGLDNINRRIKLYYGEEHGVILKQNEGKGTTARIELPKNMRGIKNDTDYAC